MILKSFSLFDLKANAYSTPFFFNHQGQAIRAVMDMLSSADSVPARHPQDFQLWELGTWDDQTGRYDPGMECLGQLTSFMPTAQPVFPGV